MNGETHNFFMFKGIILQGKKYPRLYFQRINKEHLPWIYKNKFRLRDKYWEHLSLVLLINFINLEEYCFI